MCKEADEPEQKGPVEVIIPDDLPEPSPPQEPTAGIIVPPSHTVQCPKKHDPSKVSALADLSMSDVN
jgi:hypothetical protein